MNLSPHSYGLLCIPTPGNHPLGTSHSSGARILVLTTIAFVHHPLAQHHPVGTREPESWALFFAHPLSSRVASCACLALFTSQLEKLGSNHRFRVGVFPCKRKQL